VTSRRKLATWRKSCPALKKKWKVAKMAMVGQFEEGFERAKSQVAFLYPDLDLSALDSLKIVQDGKLIEEP